MDTVYSWNINHPELAGFFGFSDNCSYHPFPLRDHITVLLMSKSVEYTGLPPFDPNSQMGRLEL